MSPEIKKHEREQTIWSALGVFRSEASRLHRDVAVVFIATAILTLLARYYGSKSFFFNAFTQLRDIEPLFSLYQHLYWFVSTFVLFLLLPLLLIVLVHRRPLRSFGLGAGDWKFGLKVSTAIVLLMIPVIWFVSAAPDFLNVYPHSRIVMGDWSLFLIYELVFILYFAGWEFIWRGYMLFGLAPHTGAATAILIQMLPFVLLHHGKPVLETAGAIIAAIALGALAWRVRSFWYSVLIHWAVMLQIDLLSTLRSRTGAFSTGLKDLQAIFDYVFS